VRFAIAAVGRPRHAALAAAIADYESRAARYWPLEAVEVREESARGAAADQVREREGRRIAERLGGFRLIICERDGTPRTSEEFARWVQRLREEGRDVAFVIGGAFGLAPALHAGAWQRLSLAPWTLPHELARLVLAEQLFRAGTIARGEPYHK